MNNFKFLEVRNGHLQINDWHGNDQQKFRILMENGAYIFKTADGDVLHVHKGSKSNDAEIKAGKNFDHGSSLFYLNRANHDFSGKCFTINTHCGKALDISGGSTKNHTKVIQYDSHGGPNQIWFIVSA